MIIINAVKLAHLYQLYYESNRLTCNKNTGTDTDKFNQSSRSSLRSCTLLIIYVILDSNPTILPS